MEEAPRRPHHLPTRRRGLRIPRSRCSHTPRRSTASAWSCSSEDKGQKDRYVMLSPKLLQDPANLVAGTERPGHWPFPGGTPDQHITTTSVAATCRKARRISEIPKPITPHSMRHAFACHLLDGAPTFARFNSCSAIAAWRQPQNICTSRPAKCARHPAHWICCLALFRWRSSLPRRNTSNRRAPCIARNWKWRTSSAATVKPIVSSMLRRYSPLNGAS